MENMQDGTGNEGGMATRLVRRAIFVPLPKKEIKRVFNNRTINLIVHASKVILKISKNRIRKSIEKK